MENQPKLTIEYVKIDALVPYDKNPRNNDPAIDAVAASIKQFGFKVPMVIDEQNSIVCGHSRLRAVQKLLKQGELPDDLADGIPCIRAKDLTPEQIRAFRIADNKVAELAEWDEELLKSEIEDLPDFDFGSFGFDMDDFTSDMADSDTSEDEFDVDAEPEEIRVKRGEIWQLGNHRLMCGDSTSEKDIADLMNGEKADLWLTDPPYNVNYGDRGEQYEEMGADYQCGKDSRKIMNDNMSDADFRKFLNSCFKIASDSMKPGATFYIAHSDSEGFNFRGACRDVGLQIRQCLIWKKDSLVLGRQDYQWIHEPILTGWKDGAGHKWRSDRKQTTVLEFDRPKKSELHPCLDPDNLVMTIGGYRRIAEIHKNDLVLAEDGTFHRVELVSKHPYKGKIYEIHASGSNYSDRATNNHPYLIAEKRKGSVKVSWKRADELKVGMYTMTPFVNYGDEEPVTELDAWAYGLWLAQGSLLKSHNIAKYPVFAICMDRTDIVEKLTKWAGDKKCTTHGNHGRGMSVFVFDSDKGRRCVELCGKYADGKRIAQEVFSWNEKLRTAFFRGYMDGDGCLISTRGYFHSKSVSRDLASQIRFIAESIGYKTYFYRFDAPNGSINGRKFKTTKPFWSVNYSPMKMRQTSRAVIEYGGRKFWIRRITKVETHDYNAAVVNLSVDGSHTFQTVTGMTHNTMKPIALFSYLMCNSTDKGDLVLETFGGSGTTLICAERTGRRCNIVELDEKYATVILNRWEEDTGKVGVKIRNADGTPCAPADAEKGGEK